jgi:hypothetical protein
MHQPEKLLIGMERGQQIRTLPLKENVIVESVKSVFPASNSCMQAEPQDDRYFNFGSCNYLPSDYVEAVKDTMRGVLVEYFFQNRGHAVFESVSNISSSTSTILQKQKGTIQTRGILNRELEEQQYHRALGLVTITCTTTKWKTNHMDSSYFLETTVQVYLDPTSQSPPSRFRLFCISNFDGTPRYQSTFDPALRVSNRVRYNDPIVIACRNGDLDKVRTLFASGIASPYDCCVTDTNITLLDIVFNQLILNLDVPKAHSNHMAKLHMMFKYLVDLGLDPGELNIQHRHQVSSPTKDKDCHSFYVLRCSHCFEEIKGMYYDCKLCTCGNFCLCQPCLEAGRRCQDLGHHEKQSLVDSNFSRTMLCYSPIESLSSIYYAMENAPYMVDVARTIICRSKQDPFEYDHGRLLEWKWYEELTNVESPVLELISKQQEWVFRWDETKPEDASPIPMIWKRINPVDLLLRTWTDLFEGPTSKGVGYPYAVFTQLSHLLDSDEVHTEFCIRAAAIIDRNQWCLFFLLWARFYYWPVRRPSLQDLLRRCIPSRYIKGYYRIASKYCPKEEPPFPYDYSHYKSADNGGYGCHFLTRHAGRSGAGHVRNSDKLGLCILPRQYDHAVFFYDGSFGGFWFYVD